MTEENEPEPEAPKEEPAKPAEVEEPKKEEEKQAAEPEKKEVEVGEGEETPSSDSQMITVRLSDLNKRFEEHRHCIKCGGIMEFRRDGICPKCRGLSDKSYPM